MNVVLVGFMGSGKTAVGRRIAQRLGYTFIDTDHFIEDQLGCSIATLFTEQGEPYFRELETRLASHLHKLDNHVIATGGGLPVSPGNSERLAGAGLTVFLNADLEEIIKRLERDTRRPKLKEGELRETVTRLLTERMPLYGKSALTINTKGKSVNRVAGEIIALLGERMAAKRRAEKSPEQTTEQQEATQKASEMEGEGAEGGESRQEDPEEALRPVGSPAPEEE